MLVRETADTLLKMQRRIQELINGRTQLLATISHDLRSPITRLKLRIDSIEDDNLRDRIDADLTDMQTMLAGALNLARNDAFREKAIKLDIASLLNSICEDMIDEGKKVNVETPDVSILMTAKPGALKRAFINLINNALTYAGEVWVNASIQNGQTIITFQDNGPGIPEEDLNEVFKPYFRSRKTKEQPGTGLGLTIVREIIEHHQGNIKISNRSEGGLAVEITF